MGPEEAPNAAADAARALVAEEVLVLVTVRALNVAQVPLPSALLLSNQTNGARSRNPYHDHDLAV